MSYQALANYRPVTEGYPLTYQGEVNDRCVVDSDCHPGLYCSQSPYGARACRPPQPADLCYPCYRDPVDQSCKRTLVNSGREVYCPDACCQRKNKFIPRRQELVADEDLACQNTFVYTFLPHGGSGVEAMYCAKLNEQGQVVAADPDCCDNSVDLTWTPEWIKYSISPQFYGSFR